MQNFYNYFMNKYPLSKTEKEYIVASNSLQMNDIIDIIYNLSSKYSYYLKIYTHEKISYIIKNYIHYTFIIKTITHLTEMKDIRCNKSSFVKNYLIHSKIIKKDLDDYKYSFNTRYRYLNRYLRNRNIHKLFDYQLPYLAYHMITLIDPPDEDITYSEILNKNYEEINISHLQSFYYGLIDFINKSNEKYKNISYYNLETKYSYITIINIIDNIQNIKFQQSEYFDSLYDLMLIFDLPDINLRIKFIKEYLNNDNKEDFIKETLFITKIYFKMIDYYINFFIINSNNNSLEFKVNSFFSEKEIVPYHEKKHLTIYDEDIFTKLSYILTKFNNTNNIKDLIYMDYISTKNNIANPHNPISEELNELNTISYKGIFNNEINFLYKLHLYNRDIAKQNT